MFGRKKTEEVETVTVQTNEKPKEAAKPVFKPSSKTVIAEGVSMVGDFVTTDPIEISGNVRGNIISESSIHVSKSGLLRGDARVADLTIDGTIEGSMVVEGLASITDSGVMRGSLQTSRFASQPGSVFDGTFTMSSAKKKTEETPQEQ